MKKSNLKTSEPLTQIDIKDPINESDNKEDGGTNTVPKMKMTLTEQIKDFVNNSNVHVSQFRLVIEDINKTTTKLVDDLWDTGITFIVSGSTDLVALNELNNKIDTIRNHTNGKIKDFHFSFKGHQLFSEFLSDYLEVAMPAFNFANFMSILMDTLTGSLSIKGKVNKNVVKKQSGLTKGLKKMFGFCNEDDETNTPDSSSKDFLNKQYGPDPTQKNGEDSGVVNAKADFENVFNFNKDELNDIDNTTEQRSSGFIRFSSCGNLDIEINPDDVISSLEELFRNAQSDKLIFPSDSPHTISPQNNGGVVDNTKLVPDLDQAASLLDKGLKNGINKVVNDGEINAVVDLPKINAEIQLNILKAIPYSLMQSVITPKVTLVPKLFLVLKGDVKKKSSEETLSFMRPMITDLGNFVTDLLVQNIFNLIKKDLINLAKKLTADFLKQRGLDYISTLKSLLALLKALKGVKFKGCQSIIDQILRLLKLLNFMPMPPLPPPLVLIGGALKPGLNHIAMVNDLKANLSEKGIETAATFPDGTPNHLMIALEETVKLMVSHIKTNAKIDVTTTGVGLAAGFGQIQ